MTLKEARGQCDRAGVPWPIYKWAKGVDLMNHPYLSGPISDYKTTVFYEGNLMVVMARTGLGYYADCVFYDPSKPYADKKGFVHTMGLSLPEESDEPSAYGFNPSKKEDDGLWVKRKGHDQLKLF